MGGSGIACTEVLLCATAADGGGGGGTGARYPPYPNPESEKPTWDILNHVCVQIFSPLVVLPYRFKNGVHIMHTTFVL